MALPAIRVASLCAGVGGLDLAVRLALPGARTVLYVEREFAAAAVLAQRMEDGVLDPAPIYSDVASFDGERWRGAVDLVVAGFPCPDYSVAGKRAGRFGKHGQVWDYVVRAIRGIQPAAVFLENVSGILVPHEHVGAGIEYVLGDLATLGFDAEWESVRASDVGAPHKRERWFCLAYDPGRGCGVLRESPGGDGLVDGGGRAVEDRGCARIGWHAQQAGITASGDGSGAGRELADPGNRQFQEPRRGPQERTGPGSAISIFPPAPNDRDGWARVLASTPWLAPAVESGLHMLVDGMAYVVDAARTDQLRACGNGVVPLQAAAALRRLIQRMK